MEMNLLLACDDKYALFWGVAIASLRNNVLPGDMVNVHILESGVSDAHKHKILQMETERLRIFFYDISGRLHKLAESGVPSFKGNYMAYARLLFKSYIPDTVRRLLYIDCDTMIKKPVNDFFEFDMGDAIIGGVQDIMPVDYVEAIGFPKKKRYICSGVLLIAVDRWNENYIFDKIGTLSKTGLKYVYSDQDYLNLIFSDRIAILPFHYGKLNLINGWKQREMTAFRGRRAEGEYPFYMELCREEPIIVHLLERPWEEYVECEEKAEWYHYLELSGFFDEFVPVPSRKTWKGILLQNTVGKIFPSHYYYIRAKRLGNYHRRYIVPKLYGKSN